MSEPDHAAKAKELAALVARLEARDVSPLEAILTAYKMGSDDATAHYEQRMTEAIAKMVKP